MSGSQNSRLVEYFVSEFYRKRALELEHIVSTRFTFKLHTLPSVGFKQFATRMAYIDQNATLTIGDIHSDDDVTFASNTMVRIEREGEEDFLAHGVNTFILQNGLLEKVIVEYKLTDDEFIYLQTILETNADKAPEPAKQEIYVEENDIEFL